MKPDWDRPSPELAENLRRVLVIAARHAAARQAVSVELMRGWHAAMMAGLGMKDGRWAGCYRGRGAAEQIWVRVGHHVGVDPDEVGTELERFEDRLLGAVAALDAAIDE